MISQYYCELADIASAKGDISQVEHYASQALRYDSSSVRASIILADLAMSAGDYTKAKRLLQQIERQDAEFLPLVMDKLVECHHRQNETEELLDYLDKLDQRQNNLPLLESHARIIERYKGRQAAIDYVMEKLRKKPSLQGMNQLLSYKDSENDKNAYMLMLGLKDAVDVMKQDQPAHQCKQCGFKTNTLYWLCPSCHNWGSVKPYVCETPC
jgi:lipopolysaccharide biosynthesis regulator YciM